MSYPTTLDSFATKADATDDVLAADHNAQSAAIVAVETELGTLPKGSFADVKARLDRTDTIGVDIYRASGSNADTASSTRTMVGYDTTRRADAGFTVVLGSGTVQVPSAGWYLIEAHARFSAADTGSTGAGLAINDGTNDVIRGIYAASTSGGITDVDCSGVCYLAASTVVRAQIYSGSTSTSLVGNASGSFYYLRVVRL